MTNYEWIFGRSIIKRRIEQHFFERYADTNKNYFYFSILKLMII